MRQVALQTTSSPFDCGGHQTHFLTINNPNWRPYSNTCKWNSMIVYLLRRNTSVFLSIFLLGILMDPFDTVKTHNTAHTKTYYHSYFYQNYSSSLSTYWSVLETIKWIYSLRSFSIKTELYYTRKTYSTTPLFWTGATGTTGTRTPLHCYQLHNFEVLIFFPMSENITCMIHTYILTT